VNYKQANDQELLQRCREDDMRAYNELFCRYSPKLYKQASRYILNVNVAEELMLDLLFNVWEKRHQRIIEGELSAYLYRCMRNMIVDYRRKIIPATTRIEETWLMETLEEQKQTDHKLMTSDAEELYRTVLASMPPQRQRVFRLSREQNLSYAEIAMEMNLSVNTVENYMASALKTFRSLTKEYFSVANQSLYILLAGCSLAGLII
jgi:RNA polymerase sigma-70 factor (family 1)